MAARDPCRAATFWWNPKRPITFKGFDSAVSEEDEPGAE